MQTLNTYLASENAAQALISIFEALAQTAAQMHNALSQAPFQNLWGSAENINVQGENQQKLDLYAHQLFYEALKKTQAVALLISEEEEQSIVLNARAEYLVAMDPLDGSSNIDINLNVGSIFSIYKRLTPQESAPNSKDILQKGQSITAAAYVLYGAATLLVLSIGKGVMVFTLHQDGHFYLTQAQLKMPKRTIYSINESQSYSEAIQQRIEKYKQEKCTARYSGALVADFHRILCKGGAYLYPSTAAYPQGKLRLLYECAPLAFLAKQAGAAANDGQQDILEILPEKLHQRCALVIDEGDF